MVELSNGQMVEDVRLALNGKVPVEFYGRVGGNVPSVEELLATIAEHAVRQCEAELRTHSSASLETEANRHAQMRRDLMVARASRITEIGYEVMHAKSPVFYDKYERKIGPANSRRTIAPGAATASRTS